MENNFFRPTELLKDSKVTGLTVRDVGNLFNAGVLKGIKTEIGCRVTKESFNNFLKFRESVQKSTYTF
jgi:hypothetical protein